MTLAMMAPKLATVRPAALNGVAEGETEAPPEGPPLTGLAPLGAAPVGAGPLAMGELRRPLEMGTRVAVFLGG